MAFNVWKILSAVCSRLIFVGHGSYSLYTTIDRISLRESKGELYWILAILFSLFLVEGAYTIIVRKGNEYKYFWPSGFIYLTIMIPITWILEVFLLDEELSCVSNIQSNTGNSTNNLALTKFCNTETTTGAKDQKMRSAIEIGMLGALVFGRWLLPRGDLTRDQLSALLLAFIGNGADVIEFLNTGNDFPSLRTTTVMYTVLAVYSLSLLQFAVVTTKTTSEYTEDDSISSPSKKNKTSHDAQLPKYLQKLMKNKPIAAKKTTATTTTTANSLNGRISSNQKKKAYPQSPSRMRAVTIANTFIGRDIKQVEKKTRAKTTIGTIAECDQNNNSNREYQLQKQRIEYAAASEYLKTLAGNNKWDEVSDVIKRGRARGFTTLTAYSNIDDDFDEEEEEKISWIANLFSKFDQEVFQVLISMLTLEMPYLISRIVFSAMYNISSVTMVFYTMKNLIMTVFLIYRLWVILSGDNEEETDRTNFRVDAMNLK